MTPTHTLLATLNGTTPIAQLASGGMQSDFQTMDSGNGHLYGGEIFAQSLSHIQSRLQIENPTMIVQSIHAQFLRPGRGGEPVIHRSIKSTRGRTFLRFEASAYQNDQLIFHALVSCQRPEEPFITHVDPQPKVPDPLTLLDEISLSQQLYGKDAQTKQALNRYMDVRHLQQSPTAKGLQGYWFRYRDSDSLTSEQQQRLLAWASDYGFLAQVLWRHNLLGRSPKFFMTSLDHSLWCYGAYNPNEWALMLCDTPVATQGRALVRGCVYQQQTLIAALTQEGLLRKRVES